VRNFLKCNSDVTSMVIALWGRVHITYLISFDLTASKPSALQTDPVCHDYDQSEQIRSHSLFRLVTGSLCSSLSLNEIMSDEIWDKYYGWTFVSGSSWRVQGRQLLFFAASLTTSYEVDQTDHQSRQHAECWPLPLSQHSAVYNGLGVVQSL